MKKVKVERPVKDKGWKRWKLKEMEKTKKNFTSNCTNTCLLYQSVPKQMRPKEAQCASLHPTATWPSGHLSSLPDARYLLTLNSLFCLSLVLSLYNSQVFWKKTVWVRRVEALCESKACDKWNSKREKMKKLIKVGRKIIWRVIKEEHKGLMSQLPGFHVFWVMPVTGNPCPNGGLIWKSKKKREMSDWVLQR